MKELSTQETAMENHNKEVHSEDTHIALEKELILFKEKTYEHLQKYSMLFELLEELVDKNQDLEQRLKSSLNMISELESKLQKLETYNKRIEGRLNALENSKLGRLTKKYWAFRKRWFCRKSHARGRKG